MYFLILGLDPSELVYNFVAPLVHAVVSYVHLRVQDPQEAKALHSKSLHGDINDFLVAHCRVF